jgi:hypothetical protein
MRPDKRTLAELKSIFGSNILAFCVRPKQPNVENGGVESGGIP